MNVAGAPDDAERTQPGEGIVLFPPATFVETTARSVSPAATVGLRKVSAHSMPVASVSVVGPRNTV